MFGFHRGRINSEVNTGKVLYTSPWEKFRNVCE
jgi:hypothetical protein